MSMFNKQVELLIEDINYVSFNNNVKYCQVLDHPCFTEITGAIYDEYGCEIIDIDYSYAIIKNIDKYIFIEIDFDFTNYDILFRIQSYKNLDDIIVQ